jgi:hypothetical protein
MVSNGVATDFADAVGDGAVQAYVLSQRVRMAKDMRTIAIIAYGRTQKDLARFLGHLRPGKAVEDHPDYENALAAIVEMIVV